MRAPLPLVVVALAGCGGAAEAPWSAWSEPGAIGAEVAAPVAAAGAVEEEPEVIAEWERWRAERRESIGGEDGWLALIGLHWLEEGEQLLGSAPEAGVVLPADRSPPRAGRLIVAGAAVAFVPEPPATVTTDGAPVTGRIALRPDVPGPPTVLEIGSLRLHVIARGGRLGLRIKDRESPGRAAFRGLDLYDYEPRLRVRARVVAPEPGEMLPIVNILGMEVPEPLAGRLSFELGGRAIELLAIANGETPADGFFVMFRDGTTAGAETYPGGRYLVVPAADGAGDTWVDFNFAYTPPCAFTSYATCPLAPDENALPFPVRAGERNPSAE